MSTNSPFRATVDITGEQQAALDRLVRLKGRSRNALIRSAIDAYLLAQFPPAEAARVDTVETVPPSAPVSSRVASARRSKKAAPRGAGHPCTHPGRKGRHEPYADGDRVICRACGVVLTIHRASTRWCTPREDSFRGRE